MVQCCCSPVAEAPPRQSPGCSNLLLTLATSLSVVPMVSCPEGRAKCIYQTKTAYFHVNISKVVSHHFVHVSLFMCV